jgi:hypothetical protein
MNIAKVALQLTSLFSEDLSTMKHQAKLSGLQENDNQQEANVYQ